MEFALDELLKFGVAGGLILFVIIRLFSYLEKKDAGRGQGGIDRAVLMDLREYMTTQTSVLQNLSRQIESHVEESRANFRRVEDKIEGIRK
ncbi:MAG: hypothetical protein PHI18_08970 [bacterium]|nr:hypothetical protein [bacterium]